MAEMTNEEAREFIRNLSIMEPVSSWPLRRKPYLPLRLGKAGDVRLWLRRRFTRRRFVKCSHVFAVSFFQLPPKFLYQLIGDGWILSECLKCVDGLDLCCWVVFISDVDRKSLARVVFQSDSTRCQ